LNGEVIENRIQQHSQAPGQGYNVVTDEVGDMIEMGVIDPTKVAVNVIRNAASVAGILLTLEAIVVDDEPEAPGESPRMPAMPSQMGGMPGMM